MFIGLKVRTDLINFQSNKYDKKMQITANVSFPTSRKWNRWCFWSTFQNLHSSSRQHGYWLLNSIPGPVYLFYFRIYKSRIPTGVPNETSVDMAKQRDEEYLGNCNITIKQAAWERGEWMRARSFFVRAYFASSTLSILFKWCTTSTNAFYLQ